MYSHGRGSDVSCDIEIRDPKVLHTQKVTSKQMNIMDLHDTFTFPAPPTDISGCLSAGSDCYILFCSDSTFSNLVSLTSICLLLKTLLMLELKAAPENMEVTGYVKSRTFLNTEVISCRGSREKRG